MDRDVYNYLLEKLGDAEEIIAGAVEASEAIPTLQEDVGTLKSDVSDLKTDVGNLKPDVSALKTAVGAFKIETYEGTLDNTSATNTFSTGITFTNFAIVGISINDIVRTSTADALVNYTFEKNGTLTLTKASMSWGGQNAIKVMVIHD